ncbi:hypothetical protein, partial [Shigella sp. FC1967]|uniref:hypothetical protein n=1 Tax=Shigella sp. FC1967 TaxID=1898041 RepID=UPI001C0A7593
HQRKLKYHHFFANLRAGIIFLYGPVFSVQKNESFIHQRKLKYHHFFANLRAGIIFLYGPVFSVQKNE